MPALRPCGGPGAREASDRQVRCPRDGDEPPLAAIILQALVATGCGAFPGACLRHLLCAWLNDLLTEIPLGTLVANLLGGFVMGLVLGAFEQFEALSPETRVLVTTGFLGGLTTFSTFSAERITLLVRGEYAWTASIIGLDVVGTITLTLVGLAVARIVLKQLA